MMVAVFVVLVIFCGMQVVINISICSHLENERDHSRDLSRRLNVLEKRGDIVDYR